MTPRAGIIAFVVGVLSAVGVFDAHAGVRVVTVELSRSPNPFDPEGDPPLVGRAIGFVLAVSGDIGPGVPVRMWVNGQISATIVSGGSRFIPLVSLGAGPNMVYADVADDGEFAATSSAHLTVTLARGTPVLTATGYGGPYQKDFTTTECAGPPEVPGVPVPFGQPPRPTGTVTSWVDNQASTMVLSVPRDLAYSCADFPIRGDTLPRGPLPIDVAYSGDANWVPVPRRTVGSVTDTYNAAIDIQRSVATAVTGQPVTFTIAVVPLPGVQGVPDGEVIVDISPERRHITLDASGKATTQATFRSTGNPNAPPTIGVFYPYSAHWYTLGTPWGLPIQYRVPVDPASVRLQFVAPPSPVYAGVPVRMRVLVSPVAPSIDPPTGYVRFSLQGSAGDPHEPPPGCLVPITDGIAECTMAFPVSGIASVQIEHNDAPAYVRASLTAGINVMPTATHGAHLSISQPSVDFGAIPAGNTSPSRSVEVTNTGDVAVVLTASASTGFMVNSQCPSSLPPSNRCTIDVAFAPANEGLQTGVLTIASDASESPQTVALSGIGSGTVNFAGTWWNAPGDSESGWGINFAHQGDTIFGTWFTHDANGRAWQMSMTFTQGGTNTFSGQIFNTTGPPLASPFNPLLVTRIPVGFGTLTFSDATHGTFTYTVNGISQTKSITPFVFGTLPTCTWGTLANLAQATNYTDTWWAAPAESESGWGVNFAHQGDTLFLTWFTFDFSGAAVQMSGTLTKITQGVYQGALIRTSGPPFSAVPFSPNQVMRTPVGTATVAFANGNAGTFNYSVTMDGRSTTQTKAITRFVFRPPGTTCH